jgi:hypothetical protein
MRSHVETLLNRVAAIGLFAAATLNLVTWLPVDVSGLTVPTVVVFVGVFVVWIPSLLIVQRRFRTLRSSTVSTNRRRNSWQISTALQGAPQWLSVTLGIAAVYVFVNFFASFAVLPGQPEYSNGTYFFNVHGSHIIIDHQRYLEGVRAQVRMFTGHPIVFYLLAMLMLHSHPGATKESA